MTAVAERLKLAGKRSGLKGQDMRKIIGKVKVAGCDLYLYISAAQDWLSLVDKDGVLLGSGTDLLAVKDEARRALVRRSTQQADREFVKA